MSALEQRNECDLFQEPIRFFASVWSRTLGRIGHIDEWHLVPVKAFDHFEFGQMSGLSEEAVVLRSALA